MLNISKSVSMCIFSLFALILVYPYSALAVDINVLVCPEGCGILVSDLYISKEMKDAGLILILILRPQADICIICSKWDITAKDGKTASLPSMMTR